VRALAQIIMRGRVQAIMSVTVLAMLSMILAPLSILSGAGVTLVTLRLGAKEGILLIFWSWIACSVISFLVFATPLPAAVFAIVFWSPLWGLALVLRHSRSIDFTLQGALLLGVLPVAFFYLAFADPAAYWLEVIREPVSEAMRNSQVSMGQNELEEMLVGLSSWMTTMLAAGYFLQLVATLLLARWWQAAIYNPGGFGEEFRSLRFHRVMVYLSLPVLLLVVLGEPANWIVALATLLLAAFFLQGLAIVHFLLKKSNANPGWIMGIYILLLLAMPYVMTALAMTGFTDTWMDYRKTKSSPGDQN